MRCLALLASIPALCLAARAPTRAAMRKAFEANRAAIVEVVGPHHRGSGVIVGAAGEVLTSVDFIALNAATVRRDGEKLAAKIVIANARLGVAVIAIDPPGQYAAAPVRLSDPPPDGTWMLAVPRSRKGLAPELVQVLRARTPKPPFFEVNEPLPPGTPLFDASGKLIALTVGPTRAGSVRAVPISAVKIELASEAAP